MRWRCAKLGRKGMNVWNRSLTTLGGDASPPRARASASCSPFLHATKLSAWALRCLLGAARQSVPLTPSLRNPLLALHQQQALLHPLLARAMATSGDQLAAEAAAKLDMADAAAPAAAPADGTAPAAPAPAEEKPHPSGLTLDQRFQLIRSVAEECISDEELRRLLNKPMPVAYDGFEPSGRMHIAQVRCPAAAVAAWG